MLLLHNLLLWFYDIVLSVNYLDCREREREREKERERERELIALLYCILV